MRTVGERSAALGAAARMAVEDPTGDDAGPVVTAGRRLASVLMGGRDRERAVGQALASHALMLAVVTEELSAATGEDYDSIALRVATRVADE